MIRPPRLIGTCQTIDHVGAARAHLFVGLMGLLAITSTIGWLLGESVITTWHFASKAYHDLEAEREREEAGA